MMKNAHLVGATAVIAATVAVTAEAQDSFFERSRYVAVADRAQPEYDPVPIRAGGFELRPRLQTGIGYRTNVFATTTDETGDAFAVVAPSIDATSTWSRHELGASLRAEHTEYIDSGFESATDLAARVFGAVDVSSELGVVGAVLAEQTFEPRASAASDPNAAEQVQVDRFGGELGANFERGRFALRGRVSLDSYDYNDVPLNGGGTLEQDFRDRDETAGSVRASYAPNRDWAVFVEGVATQRDYNDPSGPNALNRDVQGQTVRVGSNFELPVLLRGDIAVGYHQFDYDDPATENVDGLSVEGNLAWFVSQLTTVSANASRRVVDPGLETSTSATLSAASVTVDHELRRNWLVDAGVNYSNYTFEDLEREDDRYDFRLGTLWKVNRNASLRLSYVYTDQDSTLRPFTDHRIMTSVTLTP